MNRGEIELDTLTDTDRTGTKYHNNRFSACILFNKFFCLIFLAEGAVEVRGACRKLSAAGINHAVACRNMLDFRKPGHLLDDCIRESVLFGFHIKRIAQSLRLHPAFQGQDMHQFI